MSNLLSYSGLTTKVRAMQGNLIKDSMFLEMANLSSVTEVVSYIGSLNSYKGIFNNVDINELHRGDLERYLLLSIYKDFGKLYNFASVKQRKYLELYFMRYETHILKQVFREIRDKQGILMDLSIIKPYFERFSEIDIDAISKASTIDECINYLGNTVFYAPLMRVKNLGNPSLFDYELTLDLLYFETMWNSRKKFLEGTDYEVITKAYGYKIDLLNLQWIYRSKKFYNITPADTYAMLVPVNYKLKKLQLKELVESENLIAMNDIFKNTFYYNKMFNLNSGDDSFELLYKQLLDKIHSTSFKSNPYSLACVDTYLYKKQQEIAKLISLTECIRYSLTSVEIENILNNLEVK